MHDEEKPDKETILQLRRRGKKSSATPGSGRIAGRSGPHDNRTAPSRGPDPRLEYLQELFDSAPDPYVVTDCSGAVQEANRAAESLFGLSRVALVGRSLHDFVLEEEREKFLAGIASLESGTETREWEVTIVSPAGDPIPTEASVSSGQLPATRHKNLRWLFRNISERRRIEKKLDVRQAVLEEIVEKRDSELVQAKAEAEASLVALKISREYFRRTFDQSPVGAAMMGTDNRFTNANQALCRMLAYTEGELSSLTLPALIRPENREEYFKLSGGLIAGEWDDYRFDTRCIRKDGSLVWTNIAARAIRNERGHIVYYLLIVNDISGRKLAELELNIYKDHLEALVEERTAQLALSNEKLEREVWKRKEIEQFIRFRNQLLQLMSDAASRKEYMREAVERIRGWTGCSCVGIRVLNEQGAIPYEAYTGFSREFWESENAVILSRDKCMCTRIIGNQPPEAEISCMTPKGSFRCGDVQGFAAGLSPSEALGFRGICIKAGFQTVVIVPIRYEDRVIGAIHLADMAPGKAPDLMVNILESGAGLIGEAIYKFQSREKLRQTYETQRVINAILRLGLEGNDLKEILSRSLDLVLSVRDLSLEASGSIFLVEQEPEVLVMSAQRGLSHEVLHECARIAFGKCLCGRAAAERRTIFADSLTDEFHELRHDGMIPHGHYCIPIASSDNVLGVMNITVKAGHFRDQKEESFLEAVANALAGVIERKRVERELGIHTARIEQSNKDLEQFAYIASHDLNEPLRKIKVFSSMLHTRLHGVCDEDAVDRLARIEEAAGRMQQLLTDLLAYSRVGTRRRPFEKVQIGRIVEEVCGDLCVRIDKVGGAIEVGRLPELEADPTQMRQLFQNLIANALKFHGDRQPLIRVHAEEPSEGLARIYVSDNGIGFDEMFLDRIFNPFQRLHGRGEFEGTGMGLAICRRIVERHGGEITAKSSVGTGATFILDLPLTQGKDKKAGFPAIVPAG